MNGAHQKNNSRNRFRISTLIPSLFRGLRANGTYWFVLLIGISIAALSYVQVGNSQGSAGARSVPNRPATLQRTQAGEELFSARCGFCHGRDAGGGEGRPSLAAGESVDLGGRRISIG